MMLKKIAYFFNPKKAPKFNTIILGAQKCGTTSLHQSLGLHPDIFFTKTIKEPGYFLPFEVMKAYFSNRNIDLKNKDYFFRKILLKGYAGQQILGEASTFYSTKEWSSLALAKKIHNYNPRMKFLFLHRNPIDRIVSHFFHEKQKNPKLEIETFLQMSEVFGISLYSERLAPFLKVFNESQFYFIDFDALVLNPDKTLQKIFDFLQLPPHTHHGPLVHLNQKTKDENLAVKIRSKLKQRKDTKELTLAYNTFLSKLRVF